MLLFSLLTTLTIQISQPVAASPEAQAFVPKGPYVAALPPNRLHLQDNIRRRSRVNEAEFNQIIDIAEKMFSPIAKAHGAEFNFVRDWKDSTVNAYAQQTGKIWEVHMFGGLARRPEITEDGFALVLCHEIGHHLAGVAFYGNRDWASSEGQSDYFSTQACSRMLWGNSQNARYNRAIRKYVPETVQKKCAAVWKNGAAFDLCNRSAMAGLSLASLLASLQGAPAPSFDTPDMATVSTTYVKHPKAQCRLDTYMAGALCLKRFDLNVIPGLNHPDGQLSASAETTTVATSCTAYEGFDVGVRPSCWFKSKLK